MTTLQEAKEILGERFVFGPDVWLRALRKDPSILGDQPAQAPEIPWSTDVLKHPGLDQPHFLFLGFDTFDGQPFGLKMAGKLLFFPACVDKDIKSVCSFRWYLMPIGIVKGSENLTYAEQTTAPILPPEYEVPNAVERVVANILYYLWMKTEWLDADHWALTSDVAGFKPGLGGGLIGNFTMSANSRYSVQGSLKGLRKGLSIQNWPALYHDSKIGIAASRKI
jgi:hypothetical protein